MVPELGSHSFPHSCLTQGVPAVDCVFNCKHVASHVCELEKDKIGRLGTEEEEEVSGRSDRFHQNLGKRKEDEGTWLGLEAHSVSELGRNFRQSGWELRTGFEGLPGKSNCVIPSSEKAWRNTHSSRVRENKALQGFSHIQVALCLCTITARMMKNSDCSLSVLKKTFPPNQKKGVCERCRAWEREANGREPFVKVDNSLGQLKRELSHDPVIPLLAISPKELKAGCILQYYSQ